MHQAAYLFLHNTDNIPFFRLLTTVTPTVKKQIYQEVMRCKALVEIPQVKSNMCHMD